MQASADVILSMLPSTDVRANIEMLMQCHVPSFLKVQGFASVPAIQATHTGGSAPDYVEVSRLSSRAAKSSLAIIDAAGFRGFGEEEEEEIDHVHTASKGL